MITYLKGDATKPLDLNKGGNMIIAHVCNNVGAWGAGFVLALSKRWADPEKFYRMYGKDYALGQVQFVQVEPNITVANMIAQNNVISVTGIDNPSIDYVALKSSLQSVYEKALLMNASVHMPKIGSGLAGGDWDVIEEIINKVFTDIEVYVYIFN